MKKRKKGMRQVAIWMPDELLERAERMAPRLKASTDFGALLGRVTKSDLLRLAVKKGLDMLDSELPEAESGSERSEGSSKQSGWREADPNRVRGSKSEKNK